MTSTLVLSHSLLDVFLVAQTCRFLHRLHQDLILLWVLLCESLDHLVQMGIVRVLGGVGWVIPMQRQARSMYTTLTKASCLDFAVHPLHPVLNLVYGLLLAIEALDANDVKNVDDEVALDRVIQRRFSGQG